MSAGPADELVARLTREAPDGARVYSDAQLRHALPFMLLLMAGRADKAALAKDTLRLLDEFATALGVTPQMSPVEVQERVRGFYERHPIDAALQAEIERFVGAQPEGVDAAALTNRFARFIGETTTVPSAPTAPAEGQVRASPLARFQLNIEPKTEKTRE